jgi:putative ABC transport system permease protein
MGELWREVRHVVRGLRRRPGYTWAVLLTLVLGIGATTAVFSVVNGVLLSPLPHDEPEQLALVWLVDARPGFYEPRNAVTPADFRDWHDQQQVFEDMAHWQAYPVTYHDDQGPHRVDAVLAGDGFFEVLRVNAHLGRTFLPEEDVEGNDDVVILSHHIWQNQFGGDPDIVGKTLRIGMSGTSLSTVVGVMPADFQFLDRPTDLWLTVGLEADEWDNRRSHYLNVVARMKPGVKRDQAQAHMESINAGLTQLYPENLEGWGVNVESMSDAVVGEIRPALLVLLAAVGFVLLIAVVNVANLMLARTLGESRELTIRTALGAGRGRILRHKLAESLLLAVPGGLLGVAVAAIATRALIAVAPDVLPRSGMVSIFEGGVLWFALAVTLVSGLLFGLLPALHAVRLDVSRGLRDSGGRSGASKRHARIRGSFVVAQLAFSTLLLVSAGLMLATFRSLMSVDTGWEPGGVVTMNVTLTGQQYGESEDQAALYDELIPRLRSVPGVELAGATKFLPLHGVMWTWSVQIEGKPEQRDGEKRDFGYNTVSPDYFPAMRMELTRGRNLAETDRAGAPPAMVINEALVRRFFTEGEDPIGQRMYAISRAEEVFEIVGVVEDTRHATLDAEPEPAYYVNYAQLPFDFFLREMTLALRTEADPASVVPAVRAAIAEVDPSIMVSNVATMRDRVVESTARTRFAMTLLVLFAGVALSLAVIGIYGVFAYSVGERKREIGVRLAIGADAPRIIRQFLGSGGRLILLGVGLGLVAAAGLTRFQAGLLYGVEPVDLWTYALVAAVLSGAAVLGVLLPARRASRIEPMRVLREE